MGTRWVPCFVKEYLYKSQTRGQLGPCANAEQPLGLMFLHTQYLKEETSRMSLCCSVSLGKESEMGLNTTLGTGKNAIIVFRMRLYLTVLNLSKGQSFINNL